MLAIVTAALFAAATGLYLTQTIRRSIARLTQSYVTTLAPPVLRLASPVPVGRFIEETKALKAGLDRQAKEDDSGDTPVVDDDE